MDWSFDTFYPCRQQAELIAELRALAGPEKAPALAERLRELMRGLAGKGIAGQEMTRLISAGNDQLTVRVIELTARKHRLPPVSWCWLALGSEGRHEQTFVSDQDNGLIFNATDSREAEAMRALFLPFAQEVNQRLADCGFELCSGQIMAGNPAWCLSFDEWRERFIDWVRRPEPTALLNASIFFDLRPLYGAAGLADELTGWLAREAAANRRFQFQMAANALKRTVPLGMFHRFVLDKHGKYPGTIDLKIGVASLFVDAARIYGLASGIHASNTAQRFRLAVDARRLHPNDAEGWTRAFYFVQMLRLKIQQRSYLQGEEMHNHLAPREIDRSDRWFLRDALLQARSLHRRLELDYPGSHGMF